MILLGTTDGLNTQGSDRFAGAAAPAPRRVILAGGSGNLGRRLAAALLARGDEVVVLSRHARHVQRMLPGAAVIKWSPASGGRWRAELKRCDAVVDVSGAPFFSPARGGDYRRVVLGARQGATTALVYALREAGEKPRTFLSASSIAIYGFRRGDECVTERSEADVAPLSSATRELEEAAASVRRAGIRAISLRLAPILHTDGGALALLARGFGTGAPAVVGSGSQWFSWIHVDDAVRIVMAALEDPRASGPLNLTALEPVRNDELTRTLARALAVRPGPAMSVRQLGKKLGSASLLLTNGPRAFPARAIELGWSINFPTFELALADLLTAPRTTAAAALHHVGAGAGRVG